MRHCVINGFNSEIGSSSAPIATLTIGLSLERKLPGRSVTIFKKSNNEGEVFIIQLPIRILPARAW